MGKIDIFRVDFAGNKKTFYPGEIMQGSIVLKTNKELKLRGIRIYFRGESRVRWTESHTTGSGSNRRTSHRTYSNHEDHINVMSTLYGKGKLTYKLLLSDHITNACFGSSLETFKYF